MLNIECVQVVVNVESVNADIIGDFDEEAEFYFYLCKDMKPVSRHGWYKQKCYFWENLEAGNYQVRGFVRSSKDKVAMFSKTFRVIGKKAAQLLDQMSRKKIKLPPLPYSYLEKPHQDVGLVVSKQETSIPGFSSFSVKNSDSSITCLYKAASSFSRNREVAFSGSAFLDGDLIFGEDDLTDFPDMSLLENVTGDFSAFFFKEECFYLTNDFFGNSKIFYYCDDEVFIASNRVHFILLMMPILEINGKVNKKELHSLLGSGSIQPLQQLFSPNLIVEGIKILPIDKYIEIKDGCFALGDKSISHYLSSDQKTLSETEYEELLKKGANEILNNTRAVLSHPNFKHVLVDSTGGMDSRVSMAAASHMKEHREKLFINSCNTESIPEDITIGCAMASLIGVDHDDIDEISISYIKNKRAYSLLSKCLGTYFAHNLMSCPKNSRFRPSTINITGAYGEVCLRPYYSRPYLSVDEFKNFSSEAEFLKAVGNSTAISLKDSKNAYIDIFSDAIRNLPGKSIVEKYDMHYTFYRSGLHFSDTHRPRNETPRVGIIQSPSLFKLKLSVDLSNKPTLLQNDLIAYYEPFFLRLPYASKRDQEDLLSCLSDLRFYPRNSGDISIDVTNDGSSAIEARARKNVSTLNNLTQESNEELLDLLELSYLSLGYLNKKGYLDYEFSLHLMSHLEDSRGGHVLVNKIAMSCQMAAIVEYSREKSLETFSKAMLEAENFDRHEELFDQY